MTQPYPIDLGECRNVDFFFNRASNENPDLPKWVIQAKGQTFYITNLDSEVGFATKNRDSGSTRGTLRFKRARVRIDEDGTAILRAA